MLCDVSICLFRSVEALAARELQPKSLSMGSSTTHVGTRASVSSEALVSLWSNHNGTPCARAAAFAASSSL
jgi:hypothetical protein